MKRCPPLSAPYTHTSHCVLVECFWSLNRQMNSVGETGNETSLYLKTQRILKARQSMFRENNVASSQDTEIIGYLEIKTSSKPCRMAYTFLYAYRAFLWVFMASKRNEGRDYSLRFYLLPPGSTSFYIHCLAPAQFSLVATPVQLSSWEEEEAFGYLVGDKYGMAGGITRTETLFSFLNTLELKRLKSSNS